MNPIVIVYQELHGEWMTVQEKKKRRQTKFIKESNKIGNCTKISNKFNGIDNMHNRTNYEAKYN